MKAEIIVVVGLFVSYALGSLRATGGCNNTADLAMIKAKWDTFDNSIDHCGTTCLMKKSCSVACIKKDVGISGECSTCFADDIVCAATHCIVQCTKDHKSVECRACHQKYCMDTLCNCTGLSESQLPP